MIEKSLAMLNEGQIFAPVVADLLTIGNRDPHV
jgi:hypothetical protein